MDLSDSVRRQFGAAADDYARSGVHSAGPDLDAMLAAAGDVEGRSVLDIGAGTGHTALAFAARGASVVALDLTPEMLARADEAATQRGLRIETRVGAAERLPFDDASFDLAVCRVCAHHFADVAASAREARRVLAPGGAYLLVDSVSPPSPLVDTFLNAIEVIRDPSHVRDYTVGQWAETFVRAGLRFELLGQHAYRIDFDDWIARMHTPELAASQIRAMFALAPSEVRTTLRIADDDAFDIPSALMRGTRAD